MPDYPHPARRSADRKYPKPHATTYAVETEPGIVRGRLPALATRPHLSRPPKDDEAGDPLRLASLRRRRAARRAAARGAGEGRAGDARSTPATCAASASRGRTPAAANQFLAPYGSDYFYAIHGLMLDRPYVGQKTFDVLRVLDWLADVGHKEVHLVAKGWGAIPATFAAVLSDAVTRVTLKNALT